MIITLYSVVAARWDMIALQAASLRHHLVEPHELVIVDNDRGDCSPDIQREAARLGLRCLACRAPMGENNPSWAHASALNWLWKQAEGLIGFLDMDIFPFRPWSIRQAMRGNVIAGLPQHNGGFYYPWPGLTFIDKSRCLMPERVDWHPAGGRDTGGMMHDWLKATNTPMVELSSSRQDWVVREFLPPDLRERYRLEFDWEIHNGTWLHYRNATDWMGRGPNYDRPRRQLLTDFLTITGTP